MNQNILKVWGIEGDDIPYHVQHLGIDVEHTPNNGTYFYPLNNHYGLHTTAWYEQARERAIQSQAVVFYDIVNIDDEFASRFVDTVNQFDHPHKIYLTVNQSDRLLVNADVVAWDFMWNRVKLYYLDSPPDVKFGEPDRVLHHYSGPAVYKLNDLNFEHARSRIFLNLCGRNYGYRETLFELAQQSNHLGYISNRSKNISLENPPAVGAYWPVPNDFYNDSYVSVYVESNCTDPALIHLTEKTFEPLIKGHFILPFANPGSIARIRKLGFALPDFVDYSYDTMEDHATRFSAFAAEFQRLLTLDWPSLYHAHRDMILHNRRCLYDIPYDQSILRIFNV
jgi:hypothetical protein